MRVQVVVITLLLSCTLAGCVHNDFVTLGSTRKIANAETPFVTKGAYIPAIIVEFAISPITGYVDAVRNPATNENGDVYFSFIATRTLARADMSMWHHFVSIPGPLILDIVLFPISGIVDGIRILVSDD